MEKIPFSPPDITQAEIDEVVDTLRSGWITTGPKSKQFEREIAAYCGTDTAVCLNSATASLELTLRVLGIGPGDEVIVPAYTYTATASPVCHVGATLVMVDSQPDCYEMDYAQLEKAITPRPIGVTRRLGGLHSVPVRQMKLRSFSLQGSISFANTVITSFAPSPLLLLKDLSSPVTQSFSAPQTSTALKSSLRAMMFIVSVAPDKRETSSAKV